MTNRIGIVSCVWRRIERLPILLRQLEAQTDQDFDLWLIVNDASLERQVTEQAQRSDLHTIVQVNNTNRGPFARIETMHENADNYDWFMTLDDDLDFGPQLVAQWRAEALPDTVRGWKGFRFTGNYWQREPVAAGETCHYLWGSNLFVPADVVRDDDVATLNTHNGQCDDLWLCYYADHILGFDLRPADVDVGSVIDGKDSYHGLHQYKIEFLEMLRAEGWAV
jgi:glycosyltransferase involved in cell wall biosynthesis